jgi:type IV secretion system protein VirB9
MFRTPSGSPTSQRSSSKAWNEPRRFVKPADASSLEKPPVFVSASEVTDLKRQLADAQAALKKVQEAATTEVKAKSEQVRAAYPDTMQFAYNFRKDKPPFNVEAVWHDDKFSYIRAHPQEAPALCPVHCCLD